MPFLTPWRYGECVEREIRTLEVSQHVSRVVALGFVREAMVDLQRLMGEAKGSVLLLA
ncbi:MAG: (d)CMP kinase [Bacteroidaceae bacterium]|nr:(d)CMP kinase [Bacteroidaceae bacterium]